MLEMLLFAESNTSGLYLFANTAAPKAPPHLAAFFHQLEDSGGDALWGGIPGGIPGEEVRLSGVT